MRFGSGSACSDIRAGGTGTRVKSTEDNEIPSVTSEESRGFAPINYALEALKWQYNWISIAGVLGLALIAGSGLPVILAAGLELMYLSLVPQSSRFRRLVRSWKFIEEKKQQERKLHDMLVDLPADVLKRYSELELMCRGIARNYERLSSTSKMFVEQTERRLGGLLLAYLRLLGAFQLHREYLRNIKPEEIRREIKQLQERLGSDPPSVQAINQKRIEILSKRMEKFEKSQENGKVIDAQCAAIEDVLELIRDQSVSLRDPQQVNDQLDSLVRDVEHTEETVRQVEAIFELASPESELSPMGLDTEIATPSQTNRRIRT